MNQELTVTGEQLVGKGIRMAADYVDTSMQKGTAKIEARPSTYINLIAGFGGLFLAMKGGNMSPAAKQASLVIGSNILAEKIPDYAVELLAPTALPKTSYGRVASAVATIRPTVTITPSIGTAQVMPSLTATSMGSGFF